MTDPAPQIVNVDQAAAWNGAQSVSWLDREDQHANAARAHRERLLAAAAVQAGEQVLDVGCGTGKTTLAAARAAGEGGSDGAALGIDISAPMLERAREHAAAEGLANATFLVADAQVEPLGADRFDLVMSKFGVMFFEDPVAAFANFARATKVGGRLAFVSWRSLADNEWLQVMRGAAAQGRELPAPPADAPGMLGLAGHDHVTEVLTAAGWSDVVMEAVDVPFVLGPLDEACAFAAEVGVVKAVLEGLDDASRTQALSDLRTSLAAHDGPDGVALGSGIWLVTARR